MDNFDKEFHKQFNKTARSFWLVFIVNGLVGLGLLGGVIFVAVHFLKKIW